MLLSIFKGKNSLFKMMATISITAQLSQRYTNDCIYVTAATALDHAGMEARHAWRVNGLKSDEALKSYTDRLSKNQNRIMSEKLAKLANIAPAASPTATPQTVLKTIEQVLSNSVLLWPKMILYILYDDFEFNDASDKILAKCCYLSVSSKQ